MLDKINNDFNLNKILLNLRAYREELLASNIANSNTPKYQSSDINFSKTFDRILNNTSTLKHKNLTVTSDKHIDTQNNENLSDRNVIEDNSYVSKNGAVNVDLDRINFVHNGLKYHADIVFINNKFRNIMNVIQG